MNIQGPSFSLDFRKIEPRRPAAQPEPSKAEPTIQSPFGKDSAKLPAVLTGLKSEINASRDAESAKGTAEARAEEPIEDSAPEQNEIEDLSSDYEPVDNHDEETDAPDDETEAQRQKKGRQLDALEAQYHSRFLILDQLIDRLITTHDCLTQQIKDSPS